MATIANIAIGLTAKTQSFEQGMKRAGKTVDRFSLVLKKQKKIERELSATIRNTQRVRAKRHSALRKIVARKRRLLANESAAEALSLKRFKIIEKKRREILGKRRARFKKFALGAAAGAAAIAAAAIAAAVAIGFLVKRTAASTDQFAKMASRIGVSVEDLSRLEFAASQTGAATQVLTIGLQRMTRRIAEASIGMGEAQGALKELGLNVKDLAKLAPDKQFIKIANAMKKVKTEGDKVRLTFKLFDTEGVALKNTLALGEKGLKRMAEEADSLGITITELQAKKFSKMNDEIIKMDKLFAGLARRTILEVIEGLGGLDRVAEDVVASLKAIVRTIGAIATATTLLIRSFTQGPTKTFTEFKKQREVVRLQKSSRARQERKLFFERIGETDPTAARRASLGLPGLKEDTQKKILDTMIQIKNQGATRVKGFAIAG